MNRSVLKIIIVLAALLLAACSEPGSKQPRSEGPGSGSETAQTAAVAGQGPGWQTPPRCGTPYRGEGAQRLDAGKLDLGTACASLIRHYEGLRLNAYRGVSGSWFVGYGHSRGVSRGDRITKAEAERLLQEDLEDVANVVRPLLRVPVTAYEFRALTCLAFNIGEGALKRDSTLHAVNRKEYERAGDEITTLRRTRSDGPIVQHLVERRQEECALFRRL